MGQHRVCDIITILVTILQFATAVVFTFLRHSEVGEGSGLYKIHAVPEGDIETSGYGIGGGWGDLDALPLECDLAWWGGRHVWLAVYPLQALWLMYGVTTLFRRTHHRQGYLYWDPDYMPGSVYTLFGLATALNVAWIFVWDSAYLLAGCVVLTAMWLVLMVAVAVSCAALARNAEALTRLAHVIDIRLVRLLVHNGLALYATWAAVLCLLAWGRFLAYGLRCLTAENASSVSLGVLGCVLIGYFVVDVMALDAHCRYVITPYLAAILFSAAVIHRHWDPSKRNSIFAMMAMTFAGLLFFIKVAFIAIRSRSDAVNRKNSAMIDGAKPKTKVIANF